jgi:TetR/AcrR family transcriptional repressor of nem operon
MKVSKEVAAQHRAALLNAAGKLFRAKGFAGTGVAEITQAAGLTHGAFYTHFASKEALCAEVLAATLSRAAEGFERLGDVGIYIDRYLSRRHVQDRATGCPVAALGSELAREDKDMKAIFAEGLEGFLARFAASCAAKGRAARRQAIAAYAAMIGGLILARAVPDEQLSDEILAAVKAELRGRV